MLFPYPPLRIGSRSSGGGARARPVRRSPHGRRRRLAPPNDPRQTRDRIYGRSGARHHTGPGVSEFFRDAITSYDWAYVIAPDRGGTLFTLLGGQAGDDVLDLLATYHDQHGGQMNDLLRDPQVAATFSNWHS